MRRLGAKLALLGFILGLVGCQKAPTTTIPTPEQATVVITFADYEHNRNAYEPLMAEFHKLHSTIEVQFVSLEEVLGNEGHDLSKVTSAADTTILHSLPHGAEASYFRDLTPSMGADPAFDSEDFWPNLLAGCGKDGRVTGLPTTVSLSLIFFDGAAFDAAGRPRPAPGWTWNDFQQAAVALTCRGGSPCPPKDDQIVRYGFVPPFNPIRFLGPVADGVLAEAGGKLDPAALSEALTWYVDLASSGVMPPIENDTWRQTEALINDGHAAMWVDSLTNLSRRRNLLGPDVTAAPFPVPADEATSNTTPARPACAAMSAGTTHPQEAWAWLSFLTMHPLLDEPGNIPSRPSVAEASDYWDGVPADIQPTLRFALEHAWYNHDSDDLKVVEGALAQVLAGKADLTSALAQIGNLHPTPPPPVVATPIIVATPRPATAPEDVAMVDYYIDRFVHPNAAAIQALAEEFNRTHPSIRIRASAELSSDFGNFSVIAEQFDCFPWPAGVRSEALEQLYNLEPLLATEASSLIDDLYPGLLDRFRVDGDLYALPATIQPTLIYYNADYLASMGLTPPSLDWTADDFWSLAAAATSGEDEDKTYGFVPFQGDAVEFVLAAQGVSWHDLYDLTMARFDAPEVVNAVASMVALADTGIMFPLDSSHGQRERLVVSGRAALWTDLAGLRGGFIDGQDPDFQVGVAPLPLIPGVSSPSTANGLYISRRTADPGACWSWLVFLSGQPGAFIGVPARRSVTESAAWEATVGEEEAAVYRTALSRSPVDGRTDSADAQLAYPLWLWWNDALAAAFGSENPAVTLAEAQRKAEAYLDCITSIPESTGCSEEQSTACAREVDPEFKTFEELVEELRP